MAGNSATVELILKAKDNASAEVLKFAETLKRLDTMIAGTNRALGEVHWGKAWGTASQEASTATSKMLAGLREVTPTASGASGALGSLNESAQHAAKGGMRELASQVPVVGGTLAQLAGQLKGFPLLLGGIIGIGVGVIAFLQSMQAEATKTQSAIATMSLGIETSFRATMAAVAKIQAESSGNRLAIIETGYAAEIAGATAAKDAKIATAKAENDAVQNAFFGTIEQRSLAQSKFVTETAAAEADLANKTILENAKKNAAIVALDAARLAQAKSLAAELLAAQTAAQVGGLQGAGKGTSAVAAQLAADKALLQKAYTEKLAAIALLQEAESIQYEKRRAATETLMNQEVALEQSAADKRKSILEALTDGGIEIFKKLGAGFERIVQALDLAKFVQQSQAAMQTLRGLIDAVLSGDAGMKNAGVTVAGLTAGLEKLTANMQTAVAQGFAPVTEAATKAAAAETKVASATDGAAAAAGTAAPVILSLADAYLAEAAAIEKAAAASAKAVASAPTAANAPKGGNAATYGYVNGNYVPIDSGSIAAGYKGMTFQSAGPVAAAIQAYQNRYLGGDPGFTPAERSGEGGGGTASQAGYRSQPTTDMTRVGGGEWGPSYAVGGMIPGRLGSRTRITAHAGEGVGTPDTLIEAFAKALEKRGVGRPRDDSGGPVLHFQPGAIQVGPGTSQRDVETMVEMIGQQLDERMRRMGG